MYKKYFSSLIIILIISLIFIAGCSEKQIDNSATPEGLLNNYIHYFNSGEGDNVYSLLSSQTKETYDEDFIYNTVKALHDGGLEISGITIVEKEIQGNTANVKLQLKFNVQGYQKTKDKDTVFIFENGAWKLTELLK